MQFYALFDLPDMWTSRNEILSVSRVVVLLRTVADQTNLNEAASEASTGRVRIAGTTQNNRKCSIHPAGSLLAYRSFPTSAFALLALIYFIYLLLS